MISIKKLPLAYILFIGIIMLCTCCSSDEGNGWKTSSGIGSSDIVTDWTLSHEEVLEHIAGRHYTEENGDIYLYGDSEKSMVGYGFSGGNLSCITMLIPADEIKDAWLADIKNGYRFIGNISETTSVWRNTDKNTLMKIASVEWDNIPYYQIYWADAQ